MAITLDDVFLLGLGVNKRQTVPPPKKGETSYSGSDVLSSMSNLTQGKPRTGVTSF